MVWDVLVRKDNILIEGFIMLIGFTMNFSGWDGSKKIECARVQSIFLLATEI